MIVHKRRIQLHSFQRPEPPPGFVWSFWGVAFCTLDGEKLEPFLATRESDGSIAVISLETFGCPGGPMLDFRGITDWIKVTDPRVTPELRGEIREVIVQHIERIEADE